MRAGEDNAGDASPRAGEASGFENEDSSEEDKDPTGEVREGAGELKLKDRGAGDSLLAAVGVELDVIEEEEDDNSDGTSVFFSDAKP